MALLLGCGLALCCLTVGLCLPGLLLGPLLLFLRLLSLLLGFACTLLCLGTVLCPGGCSSRFFGPLALPFCLLGFLPGFALCLCCASLRLRLSAFGLGHTAGVLLGSFLCRCALPREGFCTCLGLSRTFRCAFLRLSGCALPRLLNLDVDQAVNLCVQGLLLLPAFSDYALKYLLVLL